MTANLAMMSTMLLFCLAVIYGAISDLATYTIPNWVSYGLAGLFVAFAAFGWDRAPIMSHVAIGLLVLAICLVFWKFKWLGGGDVKFLAAIALWMGPQNILPFLLVLCLASLVLVSALKFARRWNAYFQAGAWPKLVKQLIQKAEDNAVPYGLPAAFAAIVVFAPNYIGVL